MAYSNVTRYNRRCAVAPLRRCAVAPLRRCAVAPLRRAWIPPAVIAALLALALLFAAPPAGAQTVIDYDSDDDGLVEITTLAQLDAMRPDWNGDAWIPPNDLPEWRAAFPGAGPDGHGPAAMGCQTGADTPVCRGYELMADLDFDSDGDGDVDANDHAGAYWNGGAGWTPIPVYTGATFDGNGHVIRNLTINNSNLRHVGLFADIRSGSNIYRLGLEDANVSSTRPDRGNGDQDTGILAGSHQGTLRMVWATGSVTMNSTSGSGASVAKHVGGLAGYMTGSIYASYSTASVTSPTSGSQLRTGGLVGRMNSGLVHSSYSSGTITNRSRGQAGGLVGRHNGGDLRNSYASGPVYGSAGGGWGSELVGWGAFASQVYDSYGSGTTTGQGTPYGATVKTARELRRPTTYAGLFAAWNADVTGDSNADNPWDFGTSRTFPLLQVDFNNDGSASCEEFGPQPCYQEPIPPYNPAHDHPEIYQNAAYEMGVSCQVATVWTGDELTTATLTFDLGDYTRPITLALSLWDGDVFRSLQSQGIAMPELRQEGQTATVDIATDPATTRFRLDSEYGLNLVLGYADCHTDDP